MKTMQTEEYKGFNIIVRARFEEDTTVHRHTDVHYDSVFLEVVVLEKESLSRDMFFNKKESVEKNRRNRDTLYKEIKNKISKLTEESKGKIDKHIREKEMTDGLPESLLTQREDREYEINEARNILNVTLNTGMTASDINKLSKDIRMALEKVILDNKLQ